MQERDAHALHLTVKIDKQGTLEIENKMMFSWKFPVMANTFIYNGAGEATVTRPRSQDRILSLIPDKLE